MEGAGWFNLFRCEGSFTFYPQSNRTSVVVDLPALTIYVVFATLLLAFLIILPGIRKERLSTFGIVTLSLFMGGTTLVGIYNCGWHTGKSWSEALLFQNMGENMLCTKIVLNVRNNFCTQHVLPRFELGIFMY